jgi:tRNA uridine 5-carboxymethylaminomethyl modification enzyme
MVHSVPGLESAHILRPAYAVEYDFAPPVQLRHSLESKLVENLFFAGQINGTSGYEEAAGQGLVAGINAARKANNKPAVTLARHEAYIGVMIDDLVTKGTNEPYRMFTSRADHRLLLNHGSAEIRLLAHAQDTGALPAARVARIKEKRARIDRWVASFERTHEKGSGGDSLAGKIRAGLTDFLPAEFKMENHAVREEVLYKVNYRGYIDRELRQVDRLTNVERVRIPEEFDYSLVTGLKKESLQKLSSIRPETLGRASRISGVNPTDISILLVALSTSRSG